MPFTMWFCSWADYLHDSISSQARPQESLHVFLSLNPASPMKTSPGRFLEQERPRGAKTTCPKAACEQFIAGQPPNKWEPWLDQHSCLPNPQAAADAWEPQLKAQPTSRPADSGEKMTLVLSHWLGTIGIADIVIFRLNLTFFFFQFDPHVLCFVSLSLLFHFSPPPPYSFTSCTLFILWLP